MNGFCRSVASNDRALFVCFIKKCYIRCVLFNHLIMKRIFLFLILLSTIGVAVSQTQHGIVRTIARSDKNSELLPGVVIRLKGFPNAVISADDGSYDAVVAGKKEGDAIQFQSVRKNGYELRDNSFLNRSHVYSSKVGIEIVMVDLEQLAKDKERIENNAYRVAEENYRKKLAMLEEQKLNSEITVEKYRTDLAQLHENYDRYMSLISEMADRYARSDYEHMDSIDRRINKCIENGELELADSLIHTVFDPYTVLERNRAAKKEIQERIDFAQSVIDKARADIEAIKRDKDYALRVVSLGEVLAQEYLLEGNREKAVESLEKTLYIVTLLYGEDSDEAAGFRNRIEQLKETEE